MAEPIKNYCQGEKLIKGYYKTRLFRTWQHMKERCYDRKNNRFYLYGARGIIVCEEWRNNFYNFFIWAIRNGYEEDLTIDRIDPNGNYCPENCRWADMATQQNNKRTTRKITFNGVTKSVAEWSRETGINPTTILFRLDQGKKAEDVLSLQITSPQEAQKRSIEQRKRNGNCHNVEINGVTKTVTEWAREYNVNRKTIVARLHRGWDEVRAITEPLK